MKALTTALTTIRRSPYQALISILMVSITFFVGFSFSLLILGAEEVLKYFETRPQVIAFFKLDAEVGAFSQTKELMEQKDYVKSVRLVSQDDALKVYQETNKDEPLLLELVTADILPASIEVSATDLSALPKIKEDLSKVSSVESVDFQENITKQLQAWTASLRLLGLSVVCILGLISFLIIMVIVAIKAAAQKRAMSIMRMIGATKGFISFPFMLEGMIYGLVGSTIGWTAMYVALIYLTPSIQSFLGEITLLPVSWNLLLIQAGIGLGAGVILGGLAGLLAVSRLIKR